VLLAADPEVQTHRAFGLPSVELVPDDTDPATLQWPRRIAMTSFLAVKVNPTGELPEPMNVPQASEALNQKDGFQMTEADRRMASQPPQLTGHFLIDARGTIRWAHVEGDQGPTDLVSYPSDDAIMAAVEALPR
jgi:hypothetical protein